WGHMNHWELPGATTEASRLSHGRGAIAEGKPREKAADNALGTEFENLNDVAKVGLAVTPAREQEVNDYISATGVVGYHQQRIAQMSVRVPGTVWLVATGVGMPGKKGDVLAVVDSADVGRAKADLLQAFVDRDVRKKTLDRLNNVSGSVPERSLLEAEAEMREARVRVFNAHQALSNLGLPLSLSEI